jgi:hypothetical protein
VTFAVAVAELKFVPKTVAREPGATEIVPKLAALTIPRGDIDGEAQSDWSTLTTALARGCEEPGVTI